MYFLTFFVNNAFRRYPDYVKLALYVSAGMYSGSLLLSSFATQVRSSFFSVLPSRVALTGPRVHRFGN